MADTAYQTLYREEFIAGFERGTSLLRGSVTTEAQVNGNQAIFLVADSGAASAVTRGVNGLIPARADSLTQNTCTLAEWHDLVRRSKFNLEHSQGNGRAIAQKTTMKVINRKIDDDILAALANTTLNTGASITASLSLVMKSITILGNNNVDIEDEDNMFGVITPAFNAFLMQVKEYASADYVESKPLSGPARKYRRWAGVNWIRHTGISGIGTSTEDCFLYHRDAIGHAISKDSLDPVAGYNEEQAYYYTRCSATMGSKLLQNAGVVNMNHDGSSYVAA